MIRKYYVNGKLVRESGTVHRMNQLKKGETK